MMWWFLGFFGGAGAFRDTMAIDFAMQLGVYMQKAGYQHT